MPAHKLWQQQLRRVGPGRRSRVHGCRGRRQRCLLRPGMVLRESHLVPALAVRIGGDPDVPRARWPTLLFVRNLRLRPPGLQHRVRPRHLSRQDDDGRGSSHQPARSLQARLSRPSLQLHVLAHAGHRMQRALLRPLRAVDRRIHPVSRGRRRKAGITLQYTYLSAHNDAAFSESQWTASVRDVHDGLAHVGGANYWLTPQRSSMERRSTSRSRRSAATPT